MLKVNANCPIEREINILILGQTGVGKSTFVNAFINYIINDTLEQAVNDDIKVIIPFTFHFTDSATFEQKEITLGVENEHEHFTQVGHSNTQQCRSFVFPIGNRNLRFIDTPGIGDTRGIEYDTKNFHDILTFISQYEHLNAVCILFKPNEERISILFRFCVNELLRHLHINVKENLMFVFTNARSTFYKPGATKTILEGLLATYKREYDVDVPFNIDNTFCFDNEAFRYLAICKKGFQPDNEEKLSYNRSWNHSVKEYTRFMTYIGTRPLHAVFKTLSLNEAEQLIRKLPRPIAETARLIEENLELAKQYRSSRSNATLSQSNKVPTNEPEIVTFSQPRTVCTNGQCSRAVDVDGVKKIQYLKICHDNCFLRKVKQETLNDPELRECTAMDPDTGICSVCKCDYSSHIHVTYEFVKRRTFRNVQDIEKYIDDLRVEADKIKDVYRKLACFLHANAILPINNEVVEYLQYFIREEEMKRSSGAQNTEVITNLKETMDEYKKSVELLNETLANEKTASSKTDVIKTEEVFALVGTLYRLPINGPQIRQQIEKIELSQNRLSRNRDIHNTLPAKAASSIVMLQLQAILSSK